MNAEAMSRQRGPYKGRDATLSYEERLALRAVARRECKCGCGTLTRWLPGKARWAAYAVGHRERVSYRDRAWLVEQYVVLRHTLEEIAAMCGVAHPTIARHMRRHGIPRRDLSEAHIGRQTGARNPAWKGGVADWDYAAGWKVIARRIRDRDEWTCQRCDEQRTRWGHSLHVHHVDGNKLNNDPANLVSLCASCHRTVHRKEVMPV